MIKYTLIGALCLVLNCRASSFDQGKAQQILASVNQARQEAGKGPLCLSSKLMGSAMTHSNYQASQNRMTHDSPDPLMSRFTNVGFQPLGVAENVAQTGSMDAAEVMKAWLNSAQHKANIVGDYTHMGVAGASGSGQVYWTQHFGKASANEPCSDGSAPLSSPSNPAQASTTPSSAASMPGAADANFGASPGMPSSNFGAALPMGSTGATPSNQGAATMPQSIESLLNAPLNNSQNNQPAGQMNGQAAPGMTPNFAPNAPQTSPALTNRFICLRGICYRIVKSILGEGFIPDSFRPPGVDISVGPILI